MQLHLQLSPNSPCVKELKTIQPLSPVSSRMLSLLRLHLSRDQAVELARPWLKPLLQLAMLSASSLPLTSYRPYVDLSHQRSPHETQTRSTAQLQSYRYVIRIPSSSAWWPMQPIWASFNG